MFRTGGCRRADFRTPKMPFNIRNLSIRHQMIQQFLGNGHAGPENELKFRVIPLAQFSKRSHLNSEHLHPEDPLKMSLFSVVALGGGKDAVNFELLGGVVYIRHGRGRGRSPIEITAQPVEHGGVDSVGNVIGVVSAHNTPRI